MSGISPEVFAFDDEDQPLKAGDYLVIDPCYIIGEDPFWKHLCDYSFPEDGSERKQFYIILDEEHLCYVFGTRYGDGGYPVNDGTKSGEAGVDAGMLSLIPMEYVQNRDLDINLGVVVTLKTDSVPHNDDGNVTCGNITITTGDDEDEFEDDYEDEDFEEDVTFEDEDDD